MKKRFFFISLGFVIVFMCIFALKNYIELRIQEEKLANLDVDSLDLATIVNRVDELGGNVQLNWKEIVAIIGVEQDNEVKTIPDSMLVEVANSFLGDDSVLSFDEVAATYFEDEELLARAYQYLEDLTYVGYVSEKLQPDTNEAQFIGKLVELAKKSYEETGILPSITIAQAILESNWGTSDLVVEANNLFGIKADSSWGGDSVTFHTLEYSDTIIEGEFRQYDDWYSSIADHAEFLTSHPRYAEAGLFEATTYRTQAQALQDAGYSTAVDDDGNLVYAQRLGELIRQYNLQLIDHEVTSLNP